MGRSDDEAVLTGQIAADHERLPGPDDPRTLRALARLACGYDEGAYDRPAAISLGERIISDAYHALGSDDCGAGGGSGPPALGARLTGGTGAPGFRRSRGAW